MQIIPTTPPNYEEILKAFPNASKPGTIFAYAPDVYYPGGARLPQHLVDHEYVHIMRQHEVGVEKWWQLYIRDMDFRYMEELLAHRAEYRSLLATATSRQQRRAALKAVAKRLCSPLYGRIVSLENAMKEVAK